MTSSVVTNGKSSWVGSAKPNAVHDEPPRLRVGATTTAYAFLRSRSPVPDGDSVTSASLRVVVASGAAGSVTLTLKRVTKRVTWDELTYNTAPTVTATGSVSVVLSSPVDGTVATFDMTALMQTIAGGTANYGWRIESSAAVKLYGFDSPNPPKLTVDSVALPGRPTDLRPAGIGSLAKPVLTFSAPDVTGEAVIQSVQAQLSTSSSPAADSSGTWTSPTFDSGEVTALTPALDLSATAYGGLAAAATIYWHIRWKSGGVWSPWSDTVAYTRQTWSTLTITNPSGGFVQEPTPPFIATYSPGVKRYRVTVLKAADLTSIVAQSDWLDGASATTVSWTPTTPLQDGTNYTVWFDVQDTNVRTASQGDPNYLRATANFTATFVGSVTVPTLSSVALDPSLPFPLLTFTRSTAPDSFTILRDGKVIAADLDPAELLVSGTTYAYRDVSSTNMRQHTWKVAAVVNGQRSDWSTGITTSVTPKGVWLISQDYSLSVCMAGTDLSVARNDQVAVFRVLGAKKGIVISEARGFVEGTYSGEIRDEGGRTAFSYYDALEAIADAGDPVYLVTAHLALKVRVWNVAPRPNEYIRDNRIILDTALAFAEV